MGLSLSSGFNGGFLWCELWCKRCYWFPDRSSYSIPLFMYALYAPRPVWSKLEKKSLTETAKTMMSNLLQDTCTLQDYQERIKEIGNLIKDKNQDQCNNWRLSNSCLLVFHTFIWYGVAHYVPTVLQPVIMAGTLIEFGMFVHFQIYAEWYVKTYLYEQYWHMVTFVICPFEVELKNLAPISAAVREFNATWEDNTGNSFRRW